MFALSSPLVLPADDLLRACYFSFDDRYIVAFSVGGIGRSTGNGPLIMDPAHVATWDVETGERVASFTEARIECMVLSPVDHQMLAGAGFMTDSARVRDLRSGEVLREFPGRGPFAFNSDGTKLAVSSSSIGVHDLSDMAPTRLLTLPREDRELVALRFLPDDQYLVGMAYTYDQCDQFYLWNVADDISQPIAVLRLDCDDLEFSQTGRFLVSIHNTDKPHLRWWELDLSGDVQWKLLKQTDSHQYSIEQVQFSNDERYLLTVGMEELTPSSGDIIADSLHIWNVADYSCKKISLNGKGYCFAISPDSRLVAVMTGKAVSRWKDDLPEYHLGIWELSTGEQIVSAATASQKTNLLYHYPGAACFSSDGSRLAVAHAKHLEIWDTSGLYQ